MSDAANAPVSEPEHITSLPHAPLAPEQVEIVKKAVEGVREATTTVWIAPQAESITLDRGAAAFSTESATVLEFVVEDGDSLQVYQYDPAPGGGRWMRFDSAPKGGTAAEMLEKTIESEGYTPLAELTESDRGPA